MALTPIQSGIEDTKTLDFAEGSPFADNLISGVTGLFRLREIRRSRVFSDREILSKTPSTTAACTP